MPFSYALKDYDYDLPPELIAQTPAPGRAASRLLVLDTRTDLLRHLRFPDLLELLKPGDLLVVNNTRVFPARLLGRKETGGKVEFLLLEYPRPIPADGGSETAPASWSTIPAVGLLKCSKRPKIGQEIQFGTQLTGKVEELFQDGTVRLLLGYIGELSQVLEQCGQMPLPPYIQRPTGESRQDRERYQTVYAREHGAVAAPTAGLHFTEEILTRAQTRGIGLAEVTLHVGYGTFAPVRAEDIRQHRIHTETISVSRETARLINQTKVQGGTVWAVGTTTVRALEFAADETGRVSEHRGECGIYLYPGYRFKVVDNLITNFHLPHSSLLFLVSALAGRERILRSYREAVRQGYRFFSYGDAMAIITR